MPGEGRNTDITILLMALTASVLLSPLLLQVQSLTEWDANAFILINSHFTHGPGDPILWAVTQLGSVEFLLILDLALVAIGKRRWAAYLLALIICYSLIGYGMKFIVDRPRPYITYPEIQYMAAIFPGSFPSGHALGISGFCALLYKRGNRLLGVALIIAIMVLFTRVFLGMHYPLDVIIGSLIGGLIGMLVGSLSLNIEDGPPIWLEYRRPRL